MSDKFYGKNSRMCLGSVYTKKAQNKNRKGWRLSFPAFIMLKQNFFYCIND